MAGKTRALPGVIDCLSEGFGQINRILWVILFPIGLDVLLWRAPRLSAAPLADRWLGVFSQAAAQLGSQPTGASPVDAQSLEMARQWIQASPLYDLATLATWNLANASVPTFVPSQRLDPLGVIQIDGVLPVLGLALGLQLFGLVLGCIYLGFIGQQVRDGQISLSRLYRSLGRYCLSAIGFIGLVLGLVLAVSVPLSLIVGVLTMVAPVAAAVLYGAVMMSAVFVGVWMLLYLFFLVDAIVVGELGPLAAVRSSVGVVRSHLGSSLGLIGLTILISLGMQVVWSALARQPWGMALAVAGNAYIASGLAAASMLFYRHRAGAVRNPRAAGVGR